MRDLTFGRNEYEDVPEGVRVLVETVIKKLPAPQRRKYGQATWEAEAARKEAALTQAGVDAGPLAAWMTHYCGLAAHGRQASVVAQALARVERLVTEHGAAAVNAALARTLDTGRPETCTPQYLAAILRNAATGGGAAPPLPLPAPVRRATPDTPEEGWTAIMQVVAARVDADTFRTWFEPLRLKALNVKSLHVWCPDEVYQSWHGRVGAPVLNAAFEAIYGRPAKVVTAVEEEEGRA